MKSFIAFLIILVLILLFIIGINSVKADDFRLTPAQEETLESLPANLAHNYLRRLNRLHRIDEDFLRANFNAYREGAGIVLAHDYGVGMNRAYLNDALYGIGNPYN